MTRLNRNQLQEKAANKQKIVAVAAYTAPIAQLAEEYCDIILVGDSLGMVIYGLDSTLPVTVNLMINHGQAVVNATKKAFIIVDMPYGSYQTGAEQACRNAMRILKKTGCDAVKLEGGAEIADTVAYLTERGVPVVGHIGLLPQHVKQLGGYKIQGKTSDATKKLAEAAKVLEAAGAFMLVVEGVKAAAVKKIKQKTKLPLIGIGASAECAGQILVADDLLGMSAAQPKFVKNYAQLNETISTAFADYARDVREEKFPTEEHTY